MIQYRNVRHGGVVERHAPDEWLEASAGWERLDDGPEAFSGTLMDGLDDENERTESE